MENYCPHKAHAEEMTKYPSDDYAKPMQSVCLDNTTEYSKQMQSFSVDEDSPACDA